MVLFDLCSVISGKTVQDFGVLGRKKMICTLKR